MASYRTLLTSSLYTSLAHSKTLIYLRTNHMSYPCSLLKTSPSCCQLSRKKVFDLLDQFADIFAKDIDKERIWGSFRYGIKKEEKLI
ncbi:hypothetical protein DSO57_1005663 [Entomophthora muscae]|uniref:Uncharacterized protein n=1 Tax=Entomophthora muscae TaxID=34485 RepID=A0ACC2RZ15_9FUNG|nr:hypothetical protein DSO57_1005663 [Entomophthora muscae]